MRTPVAVSVVAAGDRGPDLVRAFSKLPAARVASFCDLRDDTATPFTTHTRVHRTLRLENVLEDEGVDAVAVDAPLGLRAALVRRALEADKHVFVLGSPSGDAGETAALVSAAEARGRCLFDMHQSLFRPSIEQLRRLLDTGALGTVYYVRAAHQDTTDPAGVERLWESCTDAVALVLTLLGDQPIDLAAYGESYVRSGALDLLHAHLRFATGITALIEVSALEGRRRNSLKIVGSSLTAISDDRSGSLRLFASGADVNCLPVPRQVTLAAGDALVLAAPDVDPLLSAARSFVERANARPPSSLHDAAAVVRTLERLRQAVEAEEAEKPVYGAGLRPLNLVANRR
jgi:predicted dehydrogenase